MADRDRHQLPEAVDQADGLGGLMSALTIWHTDVASQWEASLKDLTCFFQEDAERVRQKTASPMAAKRGFERPVLKPKPAKVNDSAPWATAPPGHVPRTPGTLTAMSSATTLETPDPSPPKPPVSHQAAQGPAGTSSNPHRRSISMRPQLPARQQMQGGSFQGPQSGAAVAQNNLLDPEARDKIGCWMSSNANQSTSALLLASSGTAIARRGSLPSFARSSQQLQKNSKRSPQPSAPSTPKGTPGVFVPRGANGASTPRGGVGAASSPQAASGRHAAEHEANASQNPFGRIMGFAPVTLPWDGAEEKQP